jgi:phosphohistidine phosphatase
MQLYLMQHGEATSEEDNPDRPLTARGRADVARVASRARASGLSLRTILHSGKLRAEQSARIVVDEMGAGAVSQRGGLAPNDAVAPVAAWLAQQDAESIAIIGHQPFLGRLAALLVAAVDEAQVIVFRMGGLVALVPKPHRPGFSVTWALVPEIA